MSRTHLFIALFVAGLLSILTACANSFAANQPAVPTSAPTSAPAVSAPTESSGTANSAIKVARVQGFGLFLTDNAGRTLYAYAKDTKDASNCSGSCLQNWPPFIAPAIPQAPSNINPSLLTMLKRSDGTMQVEYDGHPLYYYAGDTAPGDVKGQGIGNAWHVLSPRGNPMLNPYAPAATPTP